ncbi:MAG: Aspartyl/glutamyl-tRNA(Asn/Gln) amidotransferase subunit B [Microgenomates bacterium 39_7]|nr:MAG: Aspartyl/glutamyl-tRNA(Asn/Gln) amidotransferase subunit B [Microgenomates bacterium 39_7]
MLSKKTQLGTVGGIAMSNYTPVIGLEVHAELKTNSKMFCGCKNDPFNAPVPNIYTCPVCLGMPGALPIPNKKAIEWTIQLGLAIDCQINLFSKFDRKNYFYPDLAKGYQISQYDIPFCYQGKVETSQGTIRINRIHLEEDTGKLIHNTVKGKEVSLVDFNRSGVPLVEIVTEPDIINGEQAKEYGRKLRQLMRHLGIAECKMAEGGMRLEANISLQAPGATKLPNYKVEVKNINSFRFLEQAINYEIKRQKKILESGETPTQETRGWNPDKEETFSQRTKEEAADYRYFPDPDIPPIEFTQEEINRLRAQLPELPSTIASRWKTDYQLDKACTQILMTHEQLIQHLEETFKLALDQNIDPAQLAGDIVNKKITLPTSNKITPDQFAVKVVEKFQELHRTVELEQDKLSVVVEQVITENKDAAAKYKAGKTQVVGFLMGQVMLQLDNKPDPTQIKEALIDALK